MIRKRITIAGVSDVSLGYGSPQIPAFLRSLCEHYGADAGYVFEPDQSGRPPRHELFPDLSIIRVPTMGNPYQGEGWFEYNAQVSRHLRELNPEVLVVFSPPVTPSLWAVRGRPQLSIYYMLESLSYYVAGGRYGNFLRQLHQQLEPYIDLAIYPEENRAAIDAPLGRLLKRPLAVMYNASRPMRESTQLVPIEQRLPRFLYSGSLDRQNSLAGYFLNDSLRSMPVDLYGPVSGSDADQLRQELAAAGGNLCYHGLVDADELDAVRRRYSFSLVLWAPNNQQQYYACPNKFFEAIADGVPPISGPHPQCKMLLERYQCGILMEDWSFASFADAVKRASSIMGTAEHRQLIANCRRAAAEELNWDSQFHKVKRYIPAQL